MGLQLEVIYIYFFSEPQGLVQNSVLGPLTIVENSETRIPSEFVKYSTVEQGW